MTRPSLPDLDHGQESWDTTYNDNKDKLVAGPLPVHEVANHAAVVALAAGSFDRCVVMATDTGLLYRSDGTNWHPVGGHLRNAAEIAVGYDYVKSKVIYAKSFSFTLANAGAATQAHGVTGLDVAKGDIMRVEAAASDGTTHRLLPWYDGTDRLEVKVDATNITITSTKDETGSDAVVTIYYTK